MSQCLSLPPESSYTSTQEPHSLTLECQRPAGGWSLPRGRGAGRWCAQAFRNEAGHALEIWGTCFIIQPQELCAVSGVQMSGGRSSARTILSLPSARTVSGQNPGCRTFSFRSQENVVCSVHDPQLQASSPVPPTHPLSIREQPANSASARTWPPLMNHWTWIRFSVQPTLSILHSRRPTEGRMGRESERRVRWDVKGRPQSEL